MSISFYDTRSICFNYKLWGSIKLRQLLREGEKRARRSAACSNRYVRVLPQCVHSVNIVLGVRKCQPCLYLLKVRHAESHVCNEVVFGALNIKYFIYCSHTFAAPAWMGSESIDRVPTASLAHSFCNLAVLCWRGCG